MTETTLSKKEFVKIIDGSTVYFGGDQDWYDKYVQQFGGCGPTSAANILAYMALNDTRLEKLCDCRTNDISKEDFKKHMKEVYKVVRPMEIPFMENSKDGLQIGGIEIPLSLGIFRLTDFIEKVEKYARNKGIDLKGNLTREEPTFESAVRYIKEGLSKDCPVALLNMFNPVKMKWTNPATNKTSIQTYKQHWVTITGIIENDETGEITVEVSSWGGKGVFSFTEFWNGMDWNEAFFPIGMVYFEVGNQNVRMKPDI